MLRAPATLVALAMAVAGCSSPAVVEPPAADRMDSAVLAAEVAALGDALRGGDPTGDPVVDRAVAAADALGVRVGDVRFIEEDRSLGADLADDEQAAVASLSWQVDGFDAAPAHAEVTVHLAPDGDGDGADVTGFGGGGRPLPLWLTGDLVVRRTPGVVVAGHDEATVTRTARLARRASTAVDSALGTTTPLVVEVPASGAELDRVLGADKGRYAGIAAVTTFVGRDEGPRTPVHVFVNPDVLADLGPHGAQVVMTHEVTHLATDAVHARSPLWLLEGYADHVALRDTSLPPSRTAAQIAAQVRQKGVPDALPTAQQFDAEAGHLGALYESAWRAVEVLVAAAGEQTLHELYRRTAAGEPADDALRALYGFGEEELTRRWQADLRALARSAR